MHGTGKLISHRNISDDSFFVNLNSDLWSNSLLLHLIIVNPRGD